MVLYRMGTTKRFFLLHTHFNKTTFLVPLLLLSADPLLSNKSNDLLTFDFCSPVFSTNSFCSIIPSDSRIVSYILHSSFFSVFDNSFHLRKSVFHFSSYCYFPSNGVHYSSVIAHQAPCQLNRLPSLF
jgi:hypothetical protein